MRPLEYSFIPVLGLVLSACDMPADAPRGTPAGTGGGSVIASTTNAGPFEIGLVQSFNAVVVDSLSAEPYDARVAWVSSAPAKATAIEVGAAVALAHISSSVRTGISGDPESHRGPVLLRQSATRKTSIECSRPRLCPNHWRSTPCKEQIS
jgi:hypothetical protein